MPKVQVCHDVAAIKAMVWLRVAVCVDGAEYRAIQSMLTVDQADQLIQALMRAKGEAERCQHDANAATKISPAASSVRSGSLPASRSAR